MAEGSPPSHPASTDEKLQRLGLVESHGIELDVPALEKPQRPLPVSHLSAPAYQSPLRHHRRGSSRSKPVKETLNAKSHWGSEDDGAPSIHRLNQYSLGAEIGRGSFGCVRLAKDQYGNEFAVKEFSKSRLRRRAQSSLLRRPGPRRGGSMSFGSRFGSPTASGAGSGPDNAFELIKSEIAVMKKLDHPNLVSLVEVLDDPQEDSLYMVLELCKKGVSMKVDLGVVVDPYCEDTCRTWFRDLILGLEYLHAQGIIHRDLKPDNCLITEDDVLKIVDFGVSEMFDKHSDMSTSKSTGSPAFMPPELCVANHGNVSGRAVDIWSMGVTLYCFRFGRIPFESPNMMDLYEAIKNEELKLDEGSSEQFYDLIRRLLEKDPGKRIKMPEIREHPWVTQDGKDPLLSEEENCSHIVEEPTEHEISAAITSNMGRVLAVARAVKRFKRLLRRRRPELKDGILGHSSRYLEPPASLDKSQRDHHRPRSEDTYNRRPVEGALASEGVHHELHVTDSGNVTPRLMDSRPVSAQSDHDMEIADTDDSNTKRPRTTGAPTLKKAATIHATIDHPERHLADDENGRGHAHNPLLDTPFLNVGVGPGPASSDDESHDKDILSESPGAVEEGIFEKAYQEELDRIAANRGKSATMYLTRRVEHLSELKNREGIVNHTIGATTTGLAGIIAKAGRKLKAEEEEKARQKGEGDHEEGAEEEHRKPDDQGQEQGSS